MRLNEISINKNESSPRSKTSERLPWKRRSNLAHFVIDKYIKDMYTYKQNKFCIILSIRNLLLKINPFGKTSIETLYTSSQDVLDMHPSIYENHKTIIIMHIYISNNLLRLKPFDMLTYNHYKTVSIKKHEFKVNSEWPKILTNQIIA